ncbi:DODA-type extradiol aromatic ring-opening family dioxygenase [Hyphococcus sp.]|uniref:DODA-type extradiol aromatic ring-opening family dioxygenase n=1 Tax=Hyphococcus sp. TaxID=2038636 RepID=UPI0035C66AA3
MTGDLQNSAAGVDYEVRRLVQQYWARVDRQPGAEKDFADFFSEDAVMRLAALTLSGREQIVDFLRKRETANEAQKRVTRHVVSNYRMSLTGDRTARLHATLQVYAGAGTLPLPSEAPSGVGDFEFHCARTPDGTWRIVKIEGDSIFAGDAAPAFAKGKNEASAMRDAFCACVPHAPMLKLQARHHNEDFWAEYDRLVSEFQKYEPELVIVFGGDHVNTMHLSLMPSFVIGQSAEAIEDWGGAPGALDVPADLAIDLADNLVEKEFDIATSYAMKVDHGFSAVLEAFLVGRLDSIPVIPVFINSHYRPRPSLKRCRELGEAIGSWASSLGKRVAFLGSGGLSHDVSMIFPQYEDAPNEDVRDIMVHGHEKLGLNLQESLETVRQIMTGHAEDLLKGGESPVAANPDWDKKFLDAFAGDLRAFDAWTDELVLAGGGSGGGEVRMWIAAGAASLAAGSSPIEIDFFTPQSTLGFGLGLAHAGKKRA